jgi:hypothetical protein
MEHVYQGPDGQALLRHDARLLGLRLVSEEDQWTSLATKAGTATLDAFTAAIQVQRGKQKLRSIQDAELLRAAVVHTAQSSNKLSAEELIILQEGARHSIHTGFGMAWEDQALDLYERQCGWPVQHRNSQVRVWDFGNSGQPLGQARIGRLIHTPDLGHGDSIPIPSSEGPASKRQKTPPMPDKMIHIEGAVEVVDLTETPNVTIPVPVPDEEEYPFFSLRGAVDGIRDELVTVRSKTTEQDELDDDDGDDEDSWSFRQIIVECKHRMHQVQPTPPLYEMIQVTAYCLMYQTDAADLVQVLRIEPSPQKQSDNQKRDQKTIDSNQKITDFISTSTTTQSTATQAPSPEIKDESSPTMRISVSRITLDDPTFGHRQNWYGIVVPRLLEWTKVVYQVRSHDELRYRLLTALATDNLEHAWNMLYEQLEWLRDCDTSYRRDVATSAAS